MSAEPRLSLNSEIEPFQMAPGLVRRTLGWGERMLIAEFTVSAGGVVPPHEHPHEQVGYVASGRVEFTLGDELAPLDRKVLSAGDGYIIPGGTRHSVLGLEDSIVIDIFSPVREDYK